MAYDTTLAIKIREYLCKFPNIHVEEKKMFNGLTFMVNGKMCICVSGDNLMCRYDPKLKEEVAEKDGYQTMTMKGKECKGYCYINPVGIKSKKDLIYWVDLCLDFNERAKSSKKNQ